MAGEVGETAYQGSSPRMRGARPVGEPDGAPHGIIPAYAGSTSCTRIAARPGRDHPRVCGEHGGAVEATYDRMGSSPRMRGALRPPFSKSPSTGIIPAYAGSTRTVPCSRPPTGDHPRVCGEHSSESLRQRSQAGSSPRMRGALTLGGDEVCALGIIPAYAGSTSPPRAARGSGRDHPRVCGEHVFSAVPSSLAGSSPRMRGAPGRGLHPGRPGGIIPAYAGSTCPAPRASAAARDHPRVCGEHSPSILVTLLSRGSSPRMRGALSVWRA